jgi:hypothetical protein
MPNRSKNNSQTKYSSWTSRLGVGRGANSPTVEKFTVIETYRVEGAVEEAKTHTEL